MAATLPAPCRVCGESVVERLLDAGERRQLCRCGFETLMPAHPQQLQPSARQAWIAAQGLRLLEQLVIEIRLTREDRLRW
jgi:hypothetical protein